MMWAISQAIIQEKKREIQQWNKVFFDGIKEKFIKKKNKIAFSLDCFNQNYLPSPYPLSNTQTKFLELA